MFKKVIGISIVFQLIATIAFAQTNRQIEIFDIGKGKVIRNVQSEPEIQEEVKEFLEGITGVYVKYNPIPNEGFMIRIPIERPVMVKNKWIHELVDEVTIIFSGQENPYLMVFDDENRMHIFTFKGDTAKFLKLLNFKLNSEG